jgi:hypothetical protein
MRPTEVHTANLAPNGLESEEDLEALELASQYGNLYHIGCLIGRLINTYTNLYRVPACGCEDYRLALSYAKKHFKLLLDKDTSQVPDRHYNAVIVDPGYTSNSKEIMAEAMRISRNVVIFDRTWAKDYRDAKILNSKYAYLLAKEKDEPSSSTKK